MRDLGDGIWELGDRNWDLGFGNWELGVCLGWIVIFFLNK